MTNWKYKITIRDIIYTDYDEKKELIEIPKKGIKMSKRLSIYKFIPKRIINSFLKLQTQAQFNRKLELLYDYCDENLIWVNF